MSGSEEVGSANKLHLGTLWYRPPEIILGDSAYGMEFDSWSLGCLALEAMLGEPPFKSDVEAGTLIKIFAFRGGPKPDGHLATLPFYGKGYAAVGQPPKDPWPPNCLRNEVSLAETLNDLLQIEPQLRITARAASATPGLQGGGQLLPSHPNVSAQRGKLTLVQGAMEPALLLLLQNDPYWKEICEQMESGKCGRCCATSAEQTLGLKWEELGYVGDEPPATSRCNNLAATAPTKARSVRAFLRAFLAKNRTALLELERCIHAGLQALPPKYLGENGRDFLRHDVMTKTFCYAHIQVMRPGERRDPPHYDGGASWLHMGLTIFGRRRVRWNLPLENKESANGLSPTPPMPRSSTP